MATRRSTRSVSFLADWPLLLVLALGMALRLVVAFVFEVPRADPLTDMQVGTAMTWLEGQSTPTASWQAPLPVVSWILLLRVLRFALAPGHDVSAFHGACRAAPRSMFLLGRLATIAMAAFVIVWLFRFLRHRHGLGAATMASLLFAVSPLAVRCAGMASPECFGSLFVLLALGKGVEIYERGRSVSYVAAGIASGLAGACALHGLLLLLPLLWMHGKSRRLPRKTFPASLLDGRFLAMLLAAFIAFSLCHVPMLLRGGMPRLDSGLLWSLGNDEPGRQFLLLGRPFDSFAELVRLGQIVFGSLLGALALLLSAGSLAFRGFEKLRIFSAWIWLRILLLMLVPGAHHYSLGADVPVLALVLAVMTSLIARAAGLSSDGGLAIVLCLGFVVPSGVELNRWGSQVGRFDTRDLVRERLTMWGGRPATTAQLGAFFSELSVARSFLRTEARTRGRQAVLEAWARNLPTVEELRATGVRHVLIDQLALDWLLAHLPEGGSALRSLRQDLNRGRAVRCVVDGEAGRVRGSRIEVFTL